MEFPMRILALVAVALLFVAAGSQLYALQQHQSISLLHLLLTQPLPQQAAWIVTLAASVLHLFATLWGHERMLQQRKLSDGLSAQMRRMREEIGDLRTAQKDNKDAVSYLTRSDPETGIADLQRRLSAAEQAL